jgi:NAD(P)-dependent dehydrogenase (short-subunit alcohol dehydrogenase family)
VFFERLRGPLVSAPICVVAGGTSGIGLATAERLAADGGFVAVIGRRDSALAAAEKLVRDNGAADVLPLQADATDNSQVQAAFETVASRWGHINILINTVGPAAVGRFADLDDAAWTKAFDEGVLTGVRLIRHALPLLRQAPWGRVVNVTAMSVQHQSAGLIAYTASKAALASMTKNLAKSLAADDILVNAVAPGAVLTEPIRQAVRAVGGDPDDVRDAYRVMAEQFGAHIDLGRVALPSEVAEVIAFCASQANTFMTGATLNVDGGSDFI